LSEIAETRKEFLPLEQQMLCVKIKAKEGENRQEIRLQNIIRI